MTNIVNQQIQGNQLINNLNEMCRALFNWFGIKTVFTREPEEPFAFNCCFFTS